MARKISNTVFLERLRKFIKDSKVGLGRDSAKRDAFIGTVLEMVSSHLDASAVKAPHRGGYLVPIKPKVASPKGATVATPEMSEAADEAARKGA